MKTKLLLYCTKGKPYLFNRIIKGKSDGYYTDIVPYDIEDEYLCGKIVAECECEVEEILIKDNGNYYTNTLTNSKLLTMSCLNQKYFFEYLAGNWHKAQYGEYLFGGYALHLTNIKAFEKPLELSEVNTFYKAKMPYECEYIPLKYAPQNAMWVWYKGQKYCLVSVRPEWLCKILNGEKTIEVRRKILKGMM